MYFNVGWNSKTLTRAVANGSEIDPAPKKTNIFMKLLKAMLVPSFFR